MAIDKRTNPVEAHTGSGTSVTTGAFASNPVTGDTIVVCMASWKAAGGTTHSAPNDSVGNTYTQIGATVAIGAGNIHISVWRTENATGGSSFTVTGNVGSTAIITVVAWCLSGAHTPTSYNGDRISATGSGTAVASGATTPAPDRSSFFISLFASDLATQSGVTAGSGWEFVAGSTQTNNNTLQELYTEELAGTHTAIVGTSGTGTITSAAWGVITVSFARKWIQSTATGNYATGGTWVGGVAPGDGDCGVIMDGHVVTAAAGTNVTVGDANDTATPAIQTDPHGGNGNGTGRLIIDTNVLFTYKGPVVQGNANWVVNAGAFVYNNHPTVKLSWRICDGTATNAILTFNGGTGSNRITVQSTGAAKGYFTGFAFNNSGKIQATSVQFTSMGDSVQAFVHNDCNFSGTSFATWFRNCFFTSCSLIDYSNNYLPAGATFEVNGCTFRTPVDASGRNLFLLVANGTHTGVLFQNICSEGTLAIQGQSGTAVGLQWSNVVISNYGSAVPLDCSTAPPGGTFDLTLLYNTIQTSAAPSNIWNGTITNLCSLRSYNSNPHAMTSVWRGTTVIDTGIWEFLVDDETGDELQTILNPASVQTVLIRNIICPHSPDNNQAAGTFHNVSHAGASDNNRLTFENCTVGVSAVTASPGGAVTTENTTGGFSMVAGCRNMLWHRPTSGGGWGVYQVNGVLTNDTFRGTDFNGRWNITGDGYSPLDATFGQPDTPGQHDVVDDPQFLDSSRRFLSWGKYLNNSLTTAQQIFDELFKMNDDSGYDPRFTIAAYVRWVREGFRPLNPRFWNQGKDGNCIGAVPGIAPPSPVDFVVQQRMR